MITYWRIVILCYCPLVLVTSLTGHFSVHWQYYSLISASFYIYFFNESFSLLCHEVTAVDRTLKFNFWLQSAVACAKGTQLAYSWLLKNTPPKPSVLRCLWCCFWKNFMLSHPIIWYSLIMTVCVTFSHFKGHKRVQSYSWKKLNKYVS